MDLFGRVAARRSKALERRQRSWPVGKGTVAPWEASWGHDDSQFSPESYGDFLATSNEIHSAAMLRARLMSSLRLNLYKGWDEEKKAMPQHPAAQLLNYVNPHWTMRRLARMDELSMCVWGESFWAIETQRGKPTEIWWCKPSRMKPVPHESKYIAGWLYEPQYGGPVIPFQPEEVIWFRYPNPLDEFSALSPVVAARLAAEAASAMMTSNKAMFANGLQVAGLVVPTRPDQVFSEGQAEDLEEYLRHKLSGPDKAHRWAVMRYEAAFKQLSISPKDAEFVSGLGLTLRQVCNAYGIPVPLMNDMSSATLANVGELTKAFWAHTLVPDSQLRADEIVEQFLPRFGKSGPNYAEYDYGKVPALQEAASETWARDAQQMDRGALTINEWRAKNGMGPVPWGDTAWLPLNKGMVTVGEDGAITIQLPQGAGGPDMAAEGDGTGGGIDEAAADILKAIGGLPDDERNPVNAPPAPRFVIPKPAELDHMAARRLLAAFATNGHR